MTNICRNIFANDSFQGYKLYLAVSILCSSDFKLKTISFTEGLDNNVRNDGRWFVVHLLQCREVHRSSLQ